MFWVALAFFFVGAAPGFWAPSVTNVLNANGLEAFVPWAFIPHSLAALVSPLLFGALADQRFRADRILAATALASAGFLWLAFRSIAWGWDPVWFVFFLLLNALVSAPMWSLMATIAMRPMSHPETQFPLVRVAGTIGWILAGVLVGSVFRLDGSTRIGDCAAGAKVLLALTCLKLPATPPTVEKTIERWSDRLGLGALSLLRERDQRVYFITTALISIPLAAFYMYTPRYLADLGDSGPSATMAWGQVSEIIVMCLMGAMLTRFRIKWIFVIALVCALIRYVIFAASGHTAWLVIGLLMHGVNYSLFFVAGQIFLEKRVPLDMRAQAQALLSVMSSGLGSLIGYCLCHVLYARTAAGGDWTVFWSVLAAGVFAITLYFVVQYRGARYSEN